MDLPCRESVTLINGNLYYINKSDKLHLGCGFLTYLFFEIPAPSFLVGLKKAELVLYKIPSDACQPPCTPEYDRYFVCPLSECFSLSGNSFTPPCIDKSMCTEFTDQARIGYTDIDITKIVASWLANGQKSKGGLLLTGMPTARRLTYASNRFEAPGMRPMLRLTDEEQPRVFK